MAGFICPLLVRLVLPGWAEAGAVSGQTADRLDQEAGGEHAGGAGRVVEIGRDLDHVEPREAAGRREANAGDDLAAGEAARFEAVGGGGVSGVDPVDVDADVGRASVRRG